MKFLIPVLLVVGAAGSVFLYLDDNDSDSDSGDAVLVDEEITVEEAEEKVRALVVLDGQELTSTLLLNNAEAVASIGSIASEISDNAQVGDMYLSFTNIQVLYRPSAGKVVQTVAILRPDLSVDEAASVADSSTTVGS